MVSANRMDLYLSERRLRGFAEVSKDRRMMMMHELLKNGYWANAKS